MTTIGSVAPDRRNSLPEPGSTDVRSDVQALRGLAVLLVVAYHAEVVVPGGFVGVEVFFVVSGFVIGRRLVAELERTGSIGLRSFAARRIRRLLPALALLLVVVTALSPLLAPIGAKDVTSPTAIAASLSGANVFLARVSSGGYFAADTTLNPLLHTWSLSVEEQFYFVVPALLLVAWRWGRRSTRPLRSMRIAVAALGALSLALCVATSTGAIGGPSADRFAFYSPFTRAWEFAAGMAIVLWPTRRPLPRPAAVAEVVAGLGLIGAAALLYSDSTAFPGVAAVVPVLGAALVIRGGGGLAGTPRWRTPFDRLGDVSYGWYLWHWPLIVFAAAAFPTAGRWPLVVAAALSLVPAVASYRLVEHRFVAGSAPSAVRRPTTALAAWCILGPIVVALIAIPVTGRLVAGAEERVAPQAAAAVEEARIQSCDSPEPFGSGRGPDCVWTHGGGGPRVVLVGDSNADQFGQTLIGAASRTGSELEIATRAGCPIADVVVRADWTQDRGEDCERFQRESVDRLIEDDPDVVVVANATDLYVHDDRIELTDPVTGQSSSATDIKAAIYQRGLQRSLARLADAGLRVVLIETAPKPWAAGVDFGVERCSALLVLSRPGRCVSPSFDLSAAFTADANDLERRVAQRAGVTTWNFGEDLCPHGRCSSGSGDAPRWIEPMHVSAAAATSLAPRAADGLASVLHR